MDSPDSRSPLPAALAARYAIDAHLGRGTYGVVVRAHRLPDGLPVAIKVVNEAAPEVERERFAREAALLARLVHRRVLAILEVGEVDGRPVIVTELCEGGTLRDLICDHAPLPVPEALALAGELLEGLAAIHGLDVVHRDVKPENVFRTADGHLKVGDLGLARDPSRTRLTQTAHVIGTPRYMSPEQIRGEPATPAADLFGAGLVIYELLAGQEELVRLRTHETIFVKRPDPLPPIAQLRPEVPEAVDRWLARLLHVEAAGRPADAATARTELGRATAPRPRPRVRLPEPASPPERPPEPRPWPRMVAPAVCAAALALGALALRPAPPAPARDATVHLLERVDAAASPAPDRAARLRDSGMAALCAGRLDEAESLMRRALATGEGESETRLQLAYVLFVEGKSREMLAQRSTVQRADPPAYARWRQGEDLVGRGQVLLWKQDFAGARDAIEQARPLVPWYPAVPFFLALARAGLSDPEPALVEARRTMGAIPDVGMVLSLMAVTLKGAKKPEAARAVLALDGAAH